MEGIFNFKTFNSADFVDKSALELKNIIQELLQDSDTITIAVSGGSSPLPVYKKLSDYKIEWNRIIFFLVDERCVSILDPESNYRNINNIFFKKINAVSFSMIEDGISFKQCADNYGRKILESVQKVKNLPSFDLVILGMGLDGHIASLFPDTKALNEKDALIVLNDISQLNTQRITMTYPLLMNSKKIVMLIRGEEKKKVLIDSLTKKLPVSILIPKLDLILN
jgi:6-phosphogluconolactonase